MLLKLCLYTLASLLHAEVIRNRTVSGLVRHVAGIWLEVVRPRKVGLVLSTCTVHAFALHKRYLLLFTAIVFSIQHDTCCVIHACSLYLYVARSVTCQMVYLTHSWVNVSGTATS